MSDRIIYKGTARGRASAPPSKSYAHRYLIASFLASVCGGKSSVIHNIALSEDISATLDCIRALGGEYTSENGTVTIFGQYTKPKNDVVLNCRESGSTLRFFIPIAAALVDCTIFKGSKKLISRGIGIYENLFAEQGISCTKSDDTIKIERALRGGSFKIDGSVSSQFVTGLLFALPLLGEDSDIEIVPPVQSRPYIEITEDVLSKAGITIEVNGNHLHIPGSQKYKPLEITCEGDYSNAAFLDMFNFIGGEVEVVGLNEKSKQGDKIYKDLFTRISNGHCTIDLADCIDLGPVLFTLAAIKFGAKFVNTARLRLKESDRVADMCPELEKIGTKCTIGENNVEISGLALTENDGPLDGKCHRTDKLLRLQKQNIVFDSHNDHRIAMSMSVLASLFTATVTNGDAVCKSYPGFYDDLASLKIETREI